MTSLRERSHRGKICDRSAVKPVIIIFIIIAVLQKVQRCKPRVMNGRTLKHTYTHSQSQSHTHTEGGAASMVIAHGCWAIIITDHIYKHTHKRVRERNKINVHLNGYDCTLVFAICPALTLWLVNARRLCGILKILETKINFSKHAI